MVQAIDLGPGVEDACPPRSPASPSSPSAPAADGATVRQDGMGYPQR